MEIRLEPGGADPLKPVRAAPKPGKPASAEEKKLWQTCQDFESVMLNMVFKQMRASVKSQDPLNQGAANQTFREMLDDETAKGMARSGGIGLADTLYRQLHQIL